MEYSFDLTDVFDDIDDEDFDPSIEALIGDAFAAAERTGRETARQAAAQLAAILEAVRLARLQPDLYLSDGPRRGRAATGDLLVRSVLMELSLRLGLTRGQLRGMLNDAQILDERLPRVWAMHRAGDASSRHVRVLIEEVTGLYDPAMLAEFDERMASLIGGQTVGKLRKAARAERERLEKSTMRQRHERAAADRRMLTEDAPDGMAWVLLYTTAVNARRIEARIDGNARRLLAEGNDSRTLTQLRADICADILTGAGTPDAVRTCVYVTVPALNLIGEGTDLATLDGYGPIDDETARRLFAQAPSFQRIVTDPVRGIKLALDRSRRRATADQRAWLRLRFGTCAEPFCDRRVSDCDLDHTRDWQFMGLTNDDNLASLCRSAHTLKHKTKIRFSRNDSGTLRVTTPTGRARDTDPPPF